MKNILIFLALITFAGCNTYVVQDIIGKPTKHLDNYNKSFVVLVEYKQEFAYNKLRSYFYANQADVYKTIKNSKIYVRNLSKIFKNVNLTTDLCINVSIDEKTKMTAIKIVSLNYELAEYFYDTVKDTLQEEDRKDKEQESKRLEEIKQAEENKMKKINEGIEEQASQE